MGGIWIGAGCGPILLTFFLVDVALVHPPEHERTEPRRASFGLDRAHESCVRDGLLEDFGYFGSAPRCIQTAPDSARQLAGSLLEPSSYVHELMARNEFE